MGYKRNANHSPNPGIIQVACQHKFWETNQIANQTNQPINDKSMVIFKETTGENSGSLPISGIPSWGVEELLFVYLWISLVLTNPKKSEVAVELLNSVEKKEFNLETCFPGDFPAESFKFTPDVSSINSHPAIFQMFQVSKWIPVAQWRASAQPFYNWNGTINGQLWLGIWSIAIKFVI